MSDVSAEIKSLKTDGGKRCEICQLTRPDHAQSERRGELHHRFSEQGELVHLTPQRPEARRSTSDLALRMALIDAGVVTFDQIARAEARLRDLPPEPGDLGRGDSGDRPAEGA